MNEAILYQKSNNVQRRDAKMILDEYKNIIKWRLDGYDTLLDIGCGSGDVLIDYILPIMPITYKKLIGIDISDKMIKHAKLNYQNYKRIHFEKFDIMDTLDNNNNILLNEKFDHITSFYCLHWVQNQKKAIDNVYQLLNPNGDCLLVFLASCAIFDAYKQLSAMTKWSTYMKDVNKFISPLHFSKNPGNDFSEIMNSSGFIDYTVDVREQIYIYEGLDLLKRNIKAVNPFTERMPTSLQDEFLNDYVDIISNMNLTKKNVSDDNYCFISPYKLIVAYAKKDSSQLILT